MNMRFIHLFLVGYLVLVLGVGLALWQAGIWSRVPPTWIGIAAVLALGLGVMLSVSSGKPTLTRGD
jgi:hypothetical protein